MDDSEPEMIFQPVGDDYDDVEFSFLKAFRKKQEKQRKEGTPSFDEPNCGLAVVSRDHVYDLMHKRRGKALIISNHEFKTLPPRIGSTEDTAKIVQTVKKLGFESILKQNCTAAAMMEELQTVASDIHWDADMFVCVIMSHGEVGGVCGTDGIAIPINKLAAPFKGDKCRSLAGKPKLFFIQACRGSQHDSGVTVDMTDGSIKYKKPSCSIPTSADFLFSYSTVEDHFAFLNKRRGSCYIQTLAEELENCDGQREICTVLQRVTRSVAFDFESNADNPSHHKKKQCPSFTSTLTKQLFLSRKDK